MQSEKKEQNCGSGIFIDGKCDKSGKNGFPVAGKSAYYTYYSFGAIGIACLLVLFVLGPLVLFGKKDVPLGLLYPLLSFVVGAIANSLSVYLGSQILFFKCRFSDHVDNMDDNDNRVQVSLKRFKIRNRAEVLVHSIPAILSILLLIGLSFCKFNEIPGFSPWLLAAFAILWIFAGTTAYMTSPIQNKMMGEEIAPEKVKKIFGFEKLNFVYGKDNGLLLFMILLVLGVGGSALISNKVL